MCDNADNSDKPSITDEGILKEMPANNTWAGLFFNFSFVSLGRCSVSVYESVNIEHIFSLKDTSITEYYTLLMKLNSVILKLINEIVKLLVKNQFIKSFKRCF